MATRKRVNSIVGGGGVLLEAPLPREQLPLENRDLRVVQRWEKTLKTWLKEHVNSPPLPQDTAIPAGIVEVMRSHDEPEGTEFTLSTNSFSNGTYLDRIYDHKDKLKGPWQILMSKDGKAVMMVRFAGALAYTWREKATRLLLPLIGLAIVLYILYFTYWLR